MIPKYGFILFYPLTGKKIVLKSLAYRCHVPVISNNILILDEPDKNNDYMSLATCYDIDKFSASKQDSIVANFTNTHINILQHIAFKTSMILFNNSSSCLIHLEFKTGKEFAKTPCMAVQLFKYSSVRGGVILVQSNGNLQLFPIINGILSTSSELIPIKAHVMTFEVIDSERIACALVTGEFTVVNISSTPIIEKQVVIPFNQCFNLSLFAKNTVLFDFNNTSSNDMKSHHCLFNFETEQIFYFPIYFEREFTSVIAPGIIMALTDKGTVNLYKICSEFIFNESSLRKTMFKLQNIQVLCNVTIQCVQEN